MNGGHDLRLGEVEQVRITLDVAVVDGEPLAAEVRLREPASLEEDAPRAVEHHDPFAEKARDCVASGHASSLTGGPSGDYEAMRSRE